MPAPFRTAVVGVDGSAQSLAAAEQAARLLAPGGRLLALVVDEERIAVHAGFDAARVQDEIRQTVNESAEAAERMLAGVPDAEVRIVRGRPVSALVHAAERAGADLIAVGGRGHRLIPGAVLGSDLSGVLHEFGSSVLAARPGGERFASLVVGHDGSPEADRAAGVAEELGTEFDAPVRYVTPAPVDHRRPVDALVDACGPADLLVVGSRRLRGLASLRSVSERVAHRAPCSVLVLRGAHAAPEPGR